MSSIQESSQAGNSAGLTLPDLAERINDKHRQCEAAMNAGLQHALQVGRLLTQAKAKVSHGEWIPWVEGNCTFTRRTASGYLRLTQRWPELEANGKRASDMSYREAVKLLAPPDEEPAESGVVEESTRRAQRVLTIDEVNDFHEMQLWVAAVFGHLLNAAKECGVKDVHIIRWLAEPTGNAEILTLAKVLSELPDRCWQILRRLCTQYIGEDVVTEDHEPFHHEIAYVISRFHSGAETPPYSDRLDYCRRFRQALNSRGPRRKYTDEEILQWLEDFMVEEVVA